MDYRTSLAFRVLCVIALTVTCATTSLASPTFFYDDFDDNDVTDWDIAPTIIPAGSLSEVYDPALPDTFDGRIWGKGSGYSPPLYTGAVKDITFDASGSLIVEFVARSGPSWPNQAVLYLMTPAWPDRGEIYEGSGQFHGRIVGASAEGYGFRIYGESNRRVELERRYFDGVTLQREFLFQWQFPAPADIHNDHLYRFERDALGNWKLFIDGGPDLMGGGVNDLTFTSFGYVFAEMFRNQSCFDYIQIEAKSIADIIADLVTLIRDMGLPGGTDNALVAKLENAIAKLDRGNSAAAAKQMSAFINQVEARSGKNLTEEQANLLIELAESIGTAIRAAY